MTPVNKKELARLLDVSLPTLDQMIDRTADFPKPVRGGGPGKPYEYDADAVRAFIDLQKAAEAEAAARKSGVLDQFSLFDGDDDTADLNPTQLKALYASEREKRKLASEAGLLIPAARVEAAAIRWVDGLVQFLDALPTNMGRRFGLPVPVVKAMADDVAAFRLRLREDVINEFGSDDDAQTNGGLV